MPFQRMATLSKLSFALLIFAAWPTAARAQWTALANAPGAFLDTCVVLTDGRAMCHVYNTNRWRLLTPDINGSYQNGTWSDTADMPDGTDTTAACTPSCQYRPLYFASAVLTDGRVAVVGGEYNNGAATWTNIGFMYDPVADSWSAQLTVPFPTGQVGDASSIVLADGTYLLAGGAGAAATAGNVASFNPATLTFTALNPTGKADSNNEENWNILPDGTLLTVDARIQAQSEIYDPVANSWGNRTNTVVNMADTANLGGSAEVGPGVLRPDGTLVYFSGNSLGQNAVYDTATGTWSNTASMNFPLVPMQTFAFSVADGPASLLPNGNVLVMGSPVTNADPFNTPSHFYEMDLANNLTAVTDSPNAASFISYQGRMVLLPTGEVLLTAYDQNATQDVLLYHNGGGPLDAWRPAITSAPNTVEPGNTYTIAGRQFNGLSEGASYGDDAQSSTNFPLVRIVNRASGHVFYARTQNHSRMGVQALGSTEIISTQFTTPAGMETGLSDLYVVANGIESAQWVVNGPGLSLPGPLSLNTCLGSTATATLNVCNTGQQNLIVNNITSSDAQFSVDAPSSGYSLVISPDFCFPFQVHYTPTGYGTTNASLTVSSNYPNAPAATVSITGTSPAPDINATLVNGGSFGNVCAGSQSDLVLQLVNQGQCNLDITGLTSSNPNFELPTATTLPLVLSHDATVNIPIRFKPTGLCSDTTPQTSNITVTSNDPATPAVVLPVSGFMGCPNMVLSPPDLNGLFAFPATVSDPTGNLGCYTDRQLTVSNSGVCPLTITAMTAAPSTAFTVINPTVPVSIGPGGAAAITVRFRPTDLTGQDPAAPDELLGTLSITSNNPVSPVASLCGEPTVQSGVRVLVVDTADVPQASLDSLTLSAKGLHPGLRDRLTDAVPLSANVCGRTVTYHLDDETLPPAGTTGGNPLASYDLRAKEGSGSVAMSFTLGQCEMKEMVVRINK